MTRFSRTDSYSFVGPKGPVLQEFSDSLESKLINTWELLEKEETVLILFDDMVEVNERFQAVLDWFKARGNRMKRRYQQGAYMEKGMIYFVGADVHMKVDPETGEETPIATRGVAVEIDMRQEAAELVRKTGLEARLRKLDKI